MKRAILLTAFSAALCLASSSVVETVEADTISVPADYATIQLAINASADGDTIMVAAGTYFESINFSGKDVAVVAEHGPSVTIISGSSSSNVVTFASGETRDALISGFTMVNGSAGVRIETSDPTVEGNVISNNKVGISVRFASPLIVANEVHSNSNPAASGFTPGGIEVGGVGQTEIIGNRIHHNQGGFGAGIQLFASGTPTVRDNEIYSNTAEENGGGIFIANDTDISLVQNLIYGNRAERGGGIFVGVPADERGPFIINNTLANNVAQTDTGLYIEGFPADSVLANNIFRGDRPLPPIFCEPRTIPTPPPMLMNNNSFGPLSDPYGGSCAGYLNVGGNISSDPLFRNEAGDDYHLAEDSPSIEAGDNGAPEIPPLDLDGGPRLQDADFSGTAEIDQGVFEASPPPPRVGKLPAGNTNNADVAVPSANLWLCVASTCTGAGEGDLRVVEQATDVHTGDQNGDAIEDGLGAYEFTVEYDNLVISSVNPCDIVFGPGGAGSARGPVDELDTSAINDDCSPDPGAGGGTCSYSHILENVIHFGCATAGQIPGPTGDMDLASLLLIPHEDLANDLFPGNENGVLTIIKDNGCELVDIFGHPVNGSINGGLTPECGDLAVTVRILEGDLDLNCEVDVTDAQLIAGKYGAFFGSLLYSKWYDLEPALHDLDIDIKDLQKVFGRDGSTCQEPVPPQPPLPFPF